MKYDIFWVKSDDKSFMTNVFQWKIDIFRMKNEYLFQANILKN